MFLRPMETETWRTPADELRTFSCAEAVFELGVSARKALQEILQKWGPAVMAVPTA
jgi:hypothetical protein